MRSLFLSIVLGMAALALTASLPSQAEARPGRGWGGRSWGGRGWGWGGRGWGWGGRGWYSGWGWGGGGWYPGWGWGGYYPYGAFYYPNYGSYYPPYDYSPPTDQSAGASLYSRSDPGSGGSSSAEAELPHPTGGAAVPPPDAALILLRLADQFAEVSFDGHKTSSVGTTREYVTPELEVGKKHPYTITVAWGQGDQRTTKEQKVDVERGQTYTLDFTRVSTSTAK